jgi:hypothetical protein
MEVSGVLYVLATLPWERMLVPIEQEADTSSYEETFHSLIPPLQI